MFPFNPRSGRHMFSPRRLAVAGCLLAALLLGLQSAGLVGQSAAAIQVSGAITSDTTWRASDSPIIVTGNTILGPGVTLKIEPGVQVRFDGNYDLIIRGQLIGQGTAAAPIVFTRNGAKNWRLFQTDETAGALMRLQYAVIEYGAIVHISSSDPLVKAELLDSTVRFNNRLEIGPNATVARSTFTDQEMGLYVLGSAVTDSTFRNNDYGVVLVQGGEEFRNNLVENNRVGVFAAGGGGHIVRANVVRNNREEGLTCGTEPGPDGMGGCQGGFFEEISDNTIANNGRNGILTAGDGLIKNNTIIGNSGHGIRILSGRPTVQLNSIKQNAGDGIRSEGLPIVHQNNFVGNSGYAYAHLNRDSIDLSRNYWGTAIRNEIEARIYDFRMNPAGSGRAIFTPLTPQEIAEAVPRGQGGPGAPVIPTATTTPTATPRPGRPTPEPPPSATPGPSPTPISGLPEGFRPYYACRKSNSGDLQDTGVEVGQTPPRCLPGWELIQILAKH